MNIYIGNAFNKVVSAVAGILTSAILARYLGVSLRGELAFYVQSVGIAAVVLGLGINQSFPRFFRMNPTELTYARFVRLLWVQIALYVALAGALFMVLPEKSVLIVSVLVIVAVMYQQTEGLMATYRIKLKIVVNLGLSILRVTGCAALLLFAPRSVDNALFVQIGLWCYVIFCYLALAGSAYGLRVPRKYSLEVYRYSFVPMLTATLLLLNYSADILMLKWLGSPQDLGIYAVAGSIIAYLWLVSDAVRDILLSKASRSDDPRLILLPVRLAILGTVFAIVGFACVGPVVIPLLFGQEFSEVYPVSLVLSIGALSMVWFKLIGVMMIAEGRKNVYFLVLLGAVLVNLAANYLIIPMYGAFGAAGASVASYSLSGICFVVLYGRYHRISVREFIVPRRGDIRSLRRILTISS